MQNIMKINAALKLQLKRKLVEQIKNPEKREIVVKSAEALSPAQIEKLQSDVSILQGATLQNVIEPSLIGGLVIIDGSRIIDVSISGRLQQLTESLLQQ